MSRHLAFRRQPVDPQMAQRHQAMSLPAPTRGMREDENLSFMQPGGAIVLDNWMPTLRSVKLRGGCTRWCDLHSLDDPVPAVPDPTGSRKPIISAFEYVSGFNYRMFAGQPTKLWDVTANVPVLVKDTQTSGNYSASQLSNAAGEWMIAVNDAGDEPLRFDGALWTTLAPADLTGPGGIPRAKLVYVWKYRNRLFFIEQSSMNAWYLGIDSIGGELNIIPLSGAATKGGNLLFGASWSIDAGDGIDDKCVFCTDQGELLIFTGSNPGDPNNWRQEGRYQVPPPLGMNAHIAIGGDLLIATIEGIIPISQAITKSSAQLQLAAVTQPINRTWREQVLEKREFHWSLEKWDEFGGLFVACPGSKPNHRIALAANSVSLAWCRITGWDVMCWIRMRGDMFFGTQDGIVMQADRTGYDDGKPYVATIVGGWGTFQSQAQQTVWHQARASFSSNNNEPFQPQLAACTDFLVKIPPPPPVGEDPGRLDLWDQGLWDQALWDQPQPSAPPIRNTYWVSIGVTGYTHAPVVQVHIGQEIKPTVELLAIDATFERAGVNV